MRELADLIVAPRASTEKTPDGSKTTETFKGTLGRWHLASSSNRFLELLEEDERFGGLAVEFFGRAVDLWAREVISAYPRESMARVSAYERALVDLADLYGPEISKVKELGHMSKDTPVPFMEALRYIWLARAIQGAEQSWTKVMLDEIEQCESSGAIRPAQVQTAERLKSQLRSDGRHYDDFLRALLPPKTVVLAALYPQSERYGELAELRKMLTGPKVPTPGDTGAEVEESRPIDLTIEYVLKGKVVSRKRIRPAGPSRDIRQARRRTTTARKR